MLPHSVVFAYRNEKSIAALPVEIPHPERGLGLLRRLDGVRAPAVDAFASHIAKSFNSLELLIKRHEQAAIWGM